MVPPFFVSLSSPSSQGLSLGSKLSMSEGGALCGCTVSMDPRHKAEDDEKQGRQERERDGW